MLDKFRLILGLMNAKDKRQLVLIGFISVVNGLLSVVGIASILPFIGLISEPGLLNSNEYIQAFTRILGITSYGGAVVAFGGISLFMVVAGNLLSAVDGWYGEVFGYKKERELSERLLHNYLHIDVLEFERKKSSERAKEILSDVDRVILDTVFAMFDLISGVIVSAFIIGLLLLVDWGVTLVVSATLLGIYLVIHNFTGVRLDRLGKRYADLEADLYSDVLEALKLQKEIKLNGLSSYFVKRYSKSCGRMVSNRLRHSIISLIPQYAIEIAAYGVILLIAIYFALYSGPNTEPITLIGMYAFAAYRLLPSIADIFDSVENILFGSAILEDFVGAFEVKDDAGDASAVECVAKESIALSNVSFRYNPDGVFHLDSIHLEFPVNVMTCIKGRTGCGKSTVLNLAAGLFRPAAGAIHVDGKAIDVYGSTAWKSRIGLVPAAVNVMQVSLYENIAMGVPAADIDRQKVRAVSELVDLDAHILSLRHGYESIYGDDGLNFSSGQIQKIGLARALYRDPAILLLDESTDALDLKTENLVLSRLNQIEDMTMIFVSHRPSVQEHAAKVIDMEEVLTQ